MSRLKKHKFQKCICWHFQKMFVQFTKTFAQFIFLYHSENLSTCIEKMFNAYLENILKTCFGKNVKHVFEKC